MPDGAVLAVLDGVLERVTFANPETGYTIARIAPERGSGAGAELVTAVGPLLGAQVGEAGQHRAGQHRARCPELATLRALNVLATMRALRVSVSACAPAASAFVVVRPAR